MNKPNVASVAEELYRAIGDAVVSFQQVEQWLAEELALLLRMRDKDDQYLVSASMSYRQKVDLIVELYPRKPMRPNMLPPSSIDLARKALYAAEEYRNRVVHSFYAIECGDTGRWVRIKGSLRGRAGFSLNSSEVNVQIFKECNEALHSIRAWMLQTDEALIAATTTLRNGMSVGAV